MSNDHATACDLCLNVAAYHVTIDDGRDRWSVDLCDFHKREYETSPHYDVVKAEPLIDEPRPFDTDELPGEVGPEEIAQEDYEHGEDDWDGDDEIDEDQIEELEDAHAQEREDLIALGVIVPPDDEPPLEARHGCKHYLFMGLVAFSGLACVLMYILLALDGLSRCRSLCQ